MAFLVIARSPILMTRDDEIFADAVALAAPERAAFVDRACEQDPAARARVETLIANFERAQAYFAGPLVQAAAPLPDEKSGDEIGRYTLVEKIGEGGCGVVWRAEQREPVRRDVALKIVKLGMDTREVIARFEAERQALALMDHPAIARVFDGGATAGGRPFFIMELVRGVPITQYCDERHLGLRARAALFIEVVEAVQHAHQKGVIHRDLKPSNILVADARMEAGPRSPGGPADGIAASGPPGERALPKVIDFGIAKATQGRLTELTLQTAWQQFIGTPAYMSPEQAEPGNSDIDTRSDLYSLGVLLYELLTGDTPFERKGVASGSVDALRERLRTVDPPRPSARWRTLNEEKRAAVARLRRTDPAGLSLHLRGDLDWIVMRCLEKDRTRRYETASALALDLRRYLQHEPVAARPPSAVYLLRKLVRRHRVAFAAGGAIAAAVLLGAMVSTGLAIRATRAERAAMRSAHEQSRLRATEVALRREAETQRRAEARRWSRSEMAAATRFMEQGRIPEGLAFLIHAGQLDRDNRIVATRLLTTLSSRNFVRPSAPPIRLPVALQSSRYYGDLNPDGRIIGVRGSDSVFRLVNLETGQITGEIPLGPKVTDAHMFHNNVIVQYGSEQMEYHDPATGVFRTRWRMSDNYLLGSRGPSPDGRWAAIVDAGTIKIWDAGASRLTATIADPDRSRGLNFSPDGSRLGSIAANGLRMRLWSVPDGERILEIAVPDDRFRIIELAVSHDNRTLALLHRGGVRLYDGATGEPRGAMLRQDGHAPGGSEPVFTPDDALIIAGSRDRTAHVWRVATGERAFPPLRHGGDVSRAQVAGNGRVLFTRSGDGFRHLWDLTTGQPIVEPFKRESGGRVSLRPDGKQLVEVTVRGEIRRLSAEPTAAMPLILPALAERVGEEWAPDQPAALLRISRKRLIAVDVATGRELGAPIVFPVPISTYFRSP